MSALAEWLLFLKRKGYVVGEPKKKRGDGIKSDPLFFKKNARRKCSYYQKLMDKGDLTERQKKGFRKANEEYKQAYGYYYGDRKIGQVVKKAKDIPCNG